MSPSQFSRCVAVFLVSVVSLATLSPRPARAVDDSEFLVTSGTALRVKSPDLTATLHSDLGFGTVTAATRLVNGNYVIARNDGALFIKSPDLSSTLYSNTSFGAVSALAGLSNGTFVAASGSSLRVITPDLRRTLFTDATFGPSVAMAGLANGNFIVSQGTNLLVKKPDLSATLFSDVGFPNVTGFAGLANGNFVVSSVDNFLRVKPPDLSSTLFFDNFGTTNAMGGLLNGNFALNDTGFGGSLRIKNSSLGTQFNDLGFGNATAIGSSPFPDNPAPTASGTGFGAVAVISDWGRHLSLLDPNDLSNTVATRDFGTAALFPGIGIQSDNDLIVANGQQSGNTGYILDSKTLADKVAFPGFGAPFTDLGTVLSDDNFVIAQDTGGATPGRLALRNGETFGGIGGSDFQLGLPVTATAKQSDNDVAVIISDGPGGGADGLLLRNPDLSHKVANVGFGSGLDGLAVQSDDNIVLLMDDTAAVPNRRIISIRDGDTLGQVNFTELFDGDPFMSVATLSDDDILIGFGSGELRKFDGDTLDLELTALLDGPVSALAVDPFDAIFAGTLAGTIYQLDPDTLAILDSQGGFGSINAIALLAVPEPSSGLFFVVIGLAMLMVPCSRRSKKESAITLIGRRVIALLG